MVTDYAGRYTLTLDEDGYLPDLGALEVRVTLAAISLRGYLTDHDNGQWIDPNALAGTVVDVHDAALALETWWTLTAPADDGTVAATADV